MGRMVFGNLVAGKKAQLSGSATQPHSFAYIEDVGGILELIEPLETAGVLVRRSRELLESEIKRFTIIERDGMVIGCAALYPFDEGRVGELACVAVHDDYRGGARGALLLAELERRARRDGIAALFALTTHTAHWFFEHGFGLADIESLPPLRREAYNYARKSKILVKSLN